ncbi:amidohydrolase family protein [Novosphingobium sp.]|uniref:amidohydrolase family protein n=1 Tax=Novosphingobium sp. TaxID=1874826 RepID=UPI00261EB9D4|nr:amidohydrolase family protein [Novosphingobium sp.]
MPVATSRTIIDVHAHFLPACYVAALDDAGLVTLDRGMPIPPWSKNMALAMMDRAGISKALLSVSSPGMAPFAKAQQRTLARAVNEAAARIVREKPARFGALASLPVSDTQAAVAEIGYALDTLGLDGFILETNHNGIYPSDLQMEPILAELDRRKALVLLHPTTPACPHCGLGDMIRQRNPRPSPLIEFPFDTTRAVTEMLYSGTFARYPAIRFILAHGGGTLPFLAHRIAGFATHPAAGVAQGVTPATIIGQLASLWYDTALSASEAQLFGLRQLVGADRILFGSDWPFTPEVAVLGNLGALKSSQWLDPSELEGVLGGNAAALLAGGNQAAE